jgi:hypothetical protein
VPRAGLVGSLIRLEGLLVNQAPNADAFFMPSLTVTESGGLVQLQVGALARGRGASLQEAADDLIRCLLAVVLAFRSSGFRGSCELQPDVETMDFLYELGEIAAAGGDIRARVFG